MQWSSRQDGSNISRQALSVFSKQLRRDGLVTEGVVGMHECECGRNHEAEEDDGSIMSMQGVEGPFYDDLTRQQLPTQLVKAARRKELDYCESYNVWRRVPVSEAH